MICSHVRLTALQFVADKPVAVEEQTLIACYPYDLKTSEIKVVSKGTSTKPKNLTAPMPQPIPVAKKEVKEEKRKEKEKATPKAHHAAS